MKNGINFENESIKKMVLGANDKYARLNQFSFIAVMLFALFMSQNVFSNSIENGCFTQVTDTVKKKMPNVSELKTPKNADATNLESDKVNVDLKELQKIAEYPGGLEKFYAKIITNFDNSEMDYEGFTKINVSFVIEKDGTMSAITVNDPTMSKSMKKSIVRVLKSIKTKWSPAIKNDQPVRTGYDLPIVFNAK